MSVFLVDYENTHSLSGIATLSKDDKVVIFYSQNANSLTFDTHKRIMESPATVEYKYVGTGSQNALDFQLSTYLGYLVSAHKDSDEKIVIVSRDKGFNNVVSFWKHELSLEIQIAPNLCVETPQTAIDNAEQQAAATVAQPQEEQIATLQQPTATEPEQQQTEQTAEVAIEATQLVAEQNDHTQTVADATTEQQTATPQQKHQRKNTQQKRATQQNNVTIKAEDVVDCLKNSDVELTDEEIAQLAQIVVKYKTKATVNNHINKLLKDSAKSGTILKIIKPFIKK